MTLHAQQAGPQSSTAPQPEPLHTFSNASSIASRLGSCFLYCCAQDRGARSVLSCHHSTPSSAAVGPGKPPLAPCPNKRGTAARNRLTSTRKLRASCTSSKSASCVTPSSLCSSVAAAAPPAGEPGGAAAGKLLRRGRVAIPAPFDTASNPQARNTQLQTDRPHWLQPCTNAWPSKPLLYAPLFT